MPVGVNFVAGKSAWSPSPDPGPYFAQTGGKFDGDGIAGEFPLFLYQKLIIVKWKKRTALVRVSRLDTVRRFFL